MKFRALSSLLLKVCVFVKFKRGRWEKFYEKLVLGLVLSGLTIGSVSVYQSKPVAEQVKRRSLPALTITPTRRKDI